MSRESRTVIIAHGSHTIRAGYGIHEPLKQPSVTLTARVGLRRSHIEKLKRAGGGNGIDGVVADEEPAAAAAETVAAATTGGEESTTTAAATPAAAGEAPAHTYVVHPSDYLVGHFLEDAIKHPENYKHDPVEVFWPMVGGNVVDWAGMQALWYYLLFFSLPVVRSSNASVTLLSLPPQAITRKSSSVIHKIFFEEFNVPSFCLVDASLSCAFAVGQTNACIVDIGWHGSSVGCVYDALPVVGSVRRAGVGLGECIAYLASQLERDAGVRQALQPLVGVDDGGESASGIHEHSSRLSPQRTLLLALAEEIFTQGHVSLDAGNEDADAQQAAPADDEGNFDVLGALTSGREKEAIAEQERRNRALIEEGKEPEEVIKTAEDASKSATANASGTATPSAASTVSITFRETRVKVPASAVANAATPLLDPSVLASVDSAFFALPRVPASDKDDGDGELSLSADISNSPSLASCIADSINSIPDLERRNALWELLVITGTPTSLIKGLTSSLVSSLSSFVVGGGNISTSLVSIAGGNNASDDPASSVAFSGAQPSNVRALKTPDYFNEFKDRTDLAPFLGATIFAKLVFADSQARGYTTKAGYIQNGPSVAFAVSA